VSDVLSGVWRIEGHDRSSGGGPVLFPENAVVRDGKSGCGDDGSCHRRRGRSRPPLGLEIQVGFDSFDSILIVI
jgi:hypothetical protein